MDDINEKVEKFIIENASPKGGAKIFEILTHFCEQGYSNEEIENAIKAFSKKYVSSNDEYT